MEKKLDALLVITSFIANKVLNKTELAYLEATLAALDETPAQPKKRAGRPKKEEVDAG